MRVCPRAAVVVVTAFVGCATIRAVAWSNYDVAPYRAPSYSPCLGDCAEGGAVFGQPFKGFPLSAALIVLIFPLGFRMSCYYYRKAYFRSFFWHPGSCAVPEPNRRYKGETVFPWVFNNLHRFAFYATVVQVAFLWFDAILAFDFGGRFGVGLGSALMLTNVVLLSGYTFGCHAFRHLAGGDLACFPCSLAARARPKLWKAVPALNINHARWPRPRPAPLRLPVVHPTLVLPGLPSPAPARVVGPSRPAIGWPPPPGSPGGRRRSRRGRAGRLATRSVRTGGTCSTIRCSRGWNAASPAKTWRCRYPPCGSPNPVHSTAWRARRSRRR